MGVFLEDNLLDYLSSSIGLGPDECSETFQPLPSAPKLLSTVLARHIGRSMRTPVASYYRTTLLWTAITNGSYTTFL